MAKRRADVDVDVEPNDSAAVAVMDGVDDVQQIAANYGHSLVAAENILIDVVRHRGYDPKLSWVVVKEFITVAEHRTFSSLGWDRLRVAKELGRVWAVLHWQEIAGKSSDRQAVNVRMEKTEQRLNAEGQRGAQLRRQIADQQAELRAIEDEYTAAAADWARRQDALKQLREFADEEHKELRERQINALSSLQSEIGQIRDRLQFIENAPRLNTRSIEDQTTVRTMAAVHKPEALVKSDQRITINQAKWDEFLDELRAEYPVLQQRLKDLQAEYQAGKRKADEALDQYAR